MHSVQGENIGQLGLAGDDEPVDKLAQERATVDMPRLLGLMSELREVSRLQKMVMNTQIDTREKRRQAGFKRRDVWTRDARFMKELQKLMAEEKLKGFEELLVLAEKCQTARDDLGPLEDEGIQAEQRLEADLWRLQEAEEFICDEFRLEFQAAGTSSPGSSSTPTQYASDSDLDSSELEAAIHDSEATAVASSLLPESVASPNFPRLATSDLEITKRTEIDRYQDSTLLGIQEHDVAQTQQEIAWEMDSGYGDIDLPPETQPLHRPHTASVERYPELSTDFSTRRDRINKWLLGTVLLSHLEATVLRNQLDAEDSALPSNWSQLVLAYWNLDAAANPRLKASIPAVKDDLPDLTDLPNKLSQISNEKKVNDFLTPQRPAPPSPRIYPYFQSHSLSGYPKTHEPP